MKINIKQRLKEKLYNSSLTSKIRYSFLIVLVPLIVIVFIYFLSTYNMNQTYENMIKSASKAGDFSLDFKKDFDYETYLLIVGNKDMEESQLDEFLASANVVVDDLLDVSESSDNKERLESAKKYLNNLATYKNRIEENLIEGNKYEDNILIWENDVQIVTALLRETIFQYIYYEIRDIEQTRENYQVFYNRVMSISIIGFMVIFIILIFISIYIPKTISRPIQELCDVTDKVSKGDLSVRARASSGAEVRVLSDSMNIMIDKINELLTQVKGEQEHLRKAELELLQSQINPHFLYNTLDTIVWLAEGSDQKAVVSMVESLSDFFRTSLNQGKDIISIREELIHVSSYLKIQQVRYQDILEYEIVVPEELNDYTIPKITIQPLVENALYHGIKNRRRKGMIKITGFKQAEDFVIRVSDNGAGMNEERLSQIRQKISKKTGSDDEIYGLFNVNERIRLKYGDKYGIEVTSIYNEGTDVDIILPLITLEQEKNQPK